MWEARRDLGLVKMVQDRTNWLPGSAITQAQGIRDIVPLRTGFEFICSIPPALGKVTKLKLRGGAVVCETESGIEMIVPRRNDDRT